MLDKIKLMQSDYNKYEQTKSQIGSTIYHQPIHPIPIQKKTKYSNQKFIKKMSVGETLNSTKINGQSQFDPTAVDAYELDINRWNKDGWQVRVKLNKDMERSTS